jgi:uncharacterized membrane protein (DUF2068 family)
VPSDIQGEQRHKPLGARLVVLYKLGKGLLELAAAIAVLLVAARALPRDVLGLGFLLHEHISAKWAQIFDALLSGGTASRMHVVAAALAVDGLSSLLEGWGVWRQRPWAPWLIVVATGGLVPLEVTLLVEKFTAARMAVLVANVATVAYMVHVRGRPAVEGAAPAPHRSRALQRALAIAAVGLVCGYGVLCYLVLPWLLQHRDARRALQIAPDRAVDAAGQPSDPLNIGLVGTHEEVFAAMARAGWVPAQALSDASAVGIAEGVLLHRSDPSAPVSSLFLEGRRQDLAFEQQVGGSPRRRHHVRFWLQTGPWLDGRPLWLGAATYDRGVGLARGTGQITHEIDPDVDAERDKLIADLVGCRCTASVHRVPGVGAIPRRPHGRVFTDGFAAVAVLEPASPR